MSTPHSSDAPRALITGITGQDGTYLTELLLEKGYAVYGTSRREPHAAERALRRQIGDAWDAGRIQLFQAELADAERIFDIVQAVLPHETYHLGAQSHVGLSFESPFETVDANARGTLAMIDAVRRIAEIQPVRMYQASTSELFGKPDVWPQTEKTPFHPRNPYACSKAYAFDVSVCYREAYGVYVCNGIQYNHESPRRDPRYVTRKITQAAARIAAGRQERLELGRIDVGRDWGYAPEYVDAMWRMLQQPEPDDYIVATNEWHPLTEFLDIAFARVGRNWRDCVDSDPRLMRPSETGRLQGDYSKARDRLGWSPRTTFTELVEQMVDADVERLRRGEDD
ncbi:MAG: GDP-mannose 4,6-dehydratase [Planctomyces sp.]|nr:GDP-mannose 4,6-dehydratase [Planctomyces sp.]